MIRSTKNKTLPRLLTVVPRLLRDWLSDWGLSGKKYFGQPPYIFMVICQFAKCNKLLELLESQWWRPTKYENLWVMNGLTDMIWVKDGEPTNIIIRCKSACTNGGSAQHIFCSRWLYSVSEKYPSDIRSKARVWLVKDVNTFYLSSGEGRER